MRVLFGHSDKEFAVVIAAEKASQRVRCVLQAIYGMVPPADAPVCDPGTEIHQCLTARQTVDHDEATYC